ncbi:MAG: hypothetical protein NVSMB13_05480 [Mycobacteriales bacterium]
MSQPPEGGTPSAEHASDAQPGSENSPQGAPSTVAGSGAAERAEPGAPPPGSNQAKADPQPPSEHSEPPADTPAAPPADVAPSPVPAPGEPATGTPGSAPQAAATPPSSTARAAGSPGHPVVATRPSAPDGEVGAT